MLDRCHRVLSIAAISLAIASRASAQSAEADAETLFADGERLIAAGDVARACDAFAASNRIEPRAGALIRLGACREANHQLASALAAYHDALARVRDPRKRAVAVARIAALEPAVSRLTVSVAAASRVDGLVITRDGSPIDRALWDRAERIDGGTYVIAAHAPEREDWQATVTIDETRGNVAVDVPVLAPRAPSPPPPARSIAPIAPRAPELRSPPQRRTTRRRVALGIAAGSGGALIAGGGLAIAARSRQAAARTLCPDPSACDAATRATELAHSAHDLAIGADVAFGVAAVAIVAAGVLWKNGTPNRRVAIVPTANAGLALYGRF